jgi:hypothetical protein
MQEIIIGMLMEAQWRHRGAWKEDDRRCLIEGVQFRRRRQIW